MNFFEIFCHIMGNIYNYMSTQILNFSNISELKFGVRKYKVGQKEVFPGELNHIR
jgi:hypothetical protein